MDILSKERSITMGESTAQLIVLLIAAVCFIAALSSGIVFKRRFSTAAQVFTIIAIAMIVVFASLTSEEWADGQAAVGVMGIFIIAAIATLAGHLFSRLFLKVTSNKNN